MSRSRLMRSQSTDGLLRHTPGFCSSDRYDNLNRSSAWNYSNGYDSEFSPQYEDRYQQSSPWNGTQDTNFQRQSNRQHVTWGSMPKYSSDRDRLPSYSGSDVYRDSRYSGSQSQHRTSSESCPTHGYLGQGQAMNSKLNRNDFERSIYDSQLYPLYSNMNYSSPSNRFRPSGYYQTSSKPFAGYGLGTSKHFEIPRRNSSYSYVRDPLLDLGYYPSYGSFPRDQGRSMLASQSIFQRPTWRRSILGLNR